MCWRKASCLLLVGKVKTSRLGSPPPFLVPKGGFVRMRSALGSSLPALERLSPRRIPVFSPSDSMSWSMRFIIARRWVSWTSSMPKKVEPR